MAHGGARPGAGRPRKQKGQNPDGPKVSTVNAETPLDFMLALMRDTTEDLKLRMQMAVAAAPYVHAKVGDTPKGKKEEAQDAAQEIADGGRFAPRGSPRLAVDNG